MSINKINISLDPESYSSYSDEVIPLPKMSDNKVSNKYGFTYIQNYSQVQPHKDLYAIKDTFAYISLANSNNYNSFYKSYDIDNDE